MDQEKYKKFEDQMRGPEAVIKARLEIYLPLVRLLFNQYKEKFLAIDLGVGRGEWLQLLSTEKMPAAGVDFDSGMVATCKQKGLNVVEEDIFTYLKALEPESVSFISAFHVIEHLSNEQLSLLMELAMRALQPQGVILWETPNSQNLLVSCSEFYVDPTHVRPIPAKLVSYQAAVAGFERNISLYLNSEKKALSEVPQFSNILLATGFDLAVMAQKKVSQEVGEWFDRMVRDHETYSLAYQMGKFDHDMAVLVQNLEKRHQDLSREIVELKTAKKLTMKEKLRKLFRK